MSYMMDRSDERLRELMKTLADTIGEVVNENDDIRKTLAMMEQEGYPVNMIVASITMVSAREEEDDDMPDLSGGQMSSVLNMPDLSGGQMSSVLNMPDLSGGQMSSVLNMPGLPGGRMNLTYTAEFTLKMGQVQGRTINLS